MATGYTGPPLYENDPVRAMELLREKRNQLLKDSDMYVLPDFPHKSKQIRDAWYEYRQQLRDLPNYSTPSLLADGTLNEESVRFPVKPS
jgi:hypothetical protein